MPVNILKHIINRLKYHTEFSDEIEITLEANPTSVEAEKLKAFKDAGINRVSMGVQALDQDDLKFLGRTHTVGESLQAVDIARNVFNNYSFDLIYTRPNQSLKNWENELTKAISYASDHMSLYQLTIEKGTQFYADFYNKNKFQMPDEELSANFYELTSNIMESNGFTTYEVSNYAKNNKECRHNIAYWQYQDYLGIGPGAHSRITKNGRKYAMMMHNKPEKWLEANLNTENGLQYSTELTDKEVAEEFLLMGMRLQKGTNTSDFQVVSNIKFDDFVNRKSLEKLVSNGLIELSGENIAATKKGVLLLNSIINELVNA